MAGGSCLKCIGLRLYIGGILLMMSLEPGRGPFRMDDQLEFG